MVGITVAAASLKADPPAKRCDSVEIRKWSSGCIWCERWIQVEKPKLLKLGYKVTEVNIPKNRRVPLFHFRKSGKLVGYHSGYISAAKIDRGEF